MMMVMMMLCGITVSFRMSLLLQLLQQQRSAAATLSKKKPMLCFRVWC